MSSVSIPHKKVYTAEDVERLTSDGHRYELVEGELLPMPPTNEGHCRKTGRLHVYLGHYVLTHDLGEVYSSELGFRLARRPDTILAPDMAFIRRDRLDGLAPDKFADIPADLVVETRSPSDSNREIQAKVQRWLTFGVRIVLDLDPARQTITVHRPGEPPVTLGKTDTLTGYDVLPGFSLPLDKVFD